MILENYIRPTQVAFADFHHVADYLLFDGNKVTMRFQGVGTQKGEFDGFSPSNKVLR